MTGCPSLPPSRLGEIKSRPLTPNPSPLGGRGVHLSPLSPWGRGVGGEGETRSALRFALALRRPAARTTALSALGAVSPFAAVASVAAITTLAAFALAAVRLLGRTTAFVRRRGPALALGL